MESTLPPVIKNPSRGLPKRLKSFTLRQSGCAMTATVYPLLSKTFPIIAAPKDGWSTYASPVIKMKSGLLKPLLSHSSVVIGKKAIEMIILNALQAPIMQNIRLQALYHNFN